MLDPKFLGIGMIVGAIPGFFIGARESSTTLVFMGIAFLLLGVYMDRTKKNV